MRAVAFGRWLLTAVLAISAACYGRGKLDVWTRDRLANGHRGQITALPEKRAADYVARLADDGDRWLATIVDAVGDRRVAVSASAEAALWRITDDWSQRTIDESSPRVVLLARLLAKRCASLPAERHDFARALAQRLIAWPVDGQEVDVGRLMTDCEVLLRLPPMAPAELRVATAPPHIAPPAPEPQRLAAPGGLRISDE